jgi:plasmanylethanolamine desaturase
MPPTGPPPPRHDDVGLATRALEVASLLAAGGLVAWHLVRFAHVPELFAWWVPLAAAAGAILADFASGLVHWAADTWGRETMPLLGRRFLRPFRVHHVNPDDFLRRDPLDTNGDVALLAVPFLLAVFLLPLDAGPGRVAAVALLAFCACALPTNQVHQWAHTPHAPAPVRWLQRRGLLLSYEEHCRHHAAPYVTHYCITTGWCNRPLAALGFFPRLERAVTRLTGLTPRDDERAFAGRLAAGGMPR